MISASAADLRLRYYSYPNESGSRVELIRRLQPNTVRCAGRPQAKDILDVGAALLRAQPQGDNSKPFLAIAWVWHQTHIQPQEVLPQWQHSYRCPRRT